jgi:hypothetical protein
VERQETNMEIKKSYALVQYNKFMKGLDKADQYLSYYSVEGPGYQKSRIEVSQVQLPEKETQRGPKYDLPGRLYRDFRIHKFEKKLLVEREKRRILQDSAK